MAPNKPLTPAPTNPGNTTTTMDDNRQLMAQAKQNLIDNLHALIRRDDSLPSHRSFALQTALSINEICRDPEPELIRDIIIHCYRRVLDSRTPGAERAQLLAHIRELEARLREIQP